MSGTFLHFRIRRGVSPGKLPVETEQPRDSVLTHANPKTILLAEDEEVVRKYVVQVLELAGYRPLAACNGDEALSLFKQHADEIDACFFDMVMPGLSVYKVCNYIKSLQPELPIIFCSGFGYENYDPEDLTHAFSLLQKPYRRTVLLRTLSDAIQQSHHPSSSS